MPRIRSRRNPSTEERFGILCLNAKSEVVADRILGTGSPLRLVVTPHEVMREALRYGARTVLTWHNHPAGGSDPAGRTSSSPGGSGRRPI